MDLLLSLIFSHLKALLANNSPYPPDDDKLLDWNAVKQLQFTASTPFSVFVSLSDEAVQPLKIRPPAGKRPEVIELSDNENA